VLKFEGLAPPKGRNIVSASENIDTTVSKEARRNPRKHTHYRFLPREARSAKRGIAIVSRPSVCLYITLRYREHIGWTSSKLITRIHVISLGSSLLGAATSAI